MKTRSLTASALLGSMGVLVLIFLGGAGSTAASLPPVALVPPVAMADQAWGTLATLTGGAPAALASEMRGAESCIYPLPDGMCVYHGDLHSHTSYSDGQGTPQQAYEMARSNGLDFFAVTDHAEFLTDEEWDDILTQAQTATIEGQFIGLRGFEWSSSHSHLNVFATDHRVGADDPDYDGLDEFYAWLSEPAQINAVAQFNHPHHPKGAFDDLRYDSLADLHISTIEIHYGDALRTDKYRLALQSGWHVAPTNNSDTHVANWGARRGRNGIVAPELTPYHVINALRSRWVFATQDENLALVMRANDHWMGSVLPQGPIFFDIYAFDPDPGDLISSLELYRDGELFKGTAVNATTFTWRLDVSTPPAPGTWWYVKATQGDGDKAYTSPIWTYQPQAYDVLIRDNVQDIGDVPSADPSWQSPDIWVRHQEDGQIWHQNPVAGETNYVYARVQNVGANPISDTYVSLYWAQPALGFVWPDSWNPINATSIRIARLSPGEATIVSVPWNTSTSVPEHACLLARLWSAQDPIRSQGHARWHNNIGQKNIHIIDLGGQPPSGTLAIQDLVFYLVNLYDEPKAAQLLISSGDFPDQGSLVLRLDAELFDRWMASDLGGTVKGALVDPVARTITVTLPIDAVVYGLPLEAGEYSTATLALTVPLTSTLALQVREHIDGSEVSGNLYTTAFSRRPTRIVLEAAADRLLVQQSTVLTATVVGDGFVPVEDGTEVQLGTTLGDLSRATAQTQNGIVTVTLMAGTTPGTAVVQAGVDGVTGTVAVDVYRTCWVRLNDDATDYTTVQAAVDASTHPTDVVKVAGRCDTVNEYGGLSQVVYLSKTLTLRGGYTATNWSAPDPALFPTTLDAQGQGRALYVAGDPSADLGQSIHPALEGLSITGGTAENLGGGTAGEDTGGGVYVTRAMVTLRGAHIFNNSADAGAGLFLSSGAATLVNGLVVDNQGAGLHVEGSSARLWHTTLARNDSGIHVTNSGPDYSTVALTNTILVSHTLGITVAAGNTARLEATLWGAAAWANEADWGGTGTVLTGTHNYRGDPVFKSPPAGDYHIGPGSAALDAGVKTQVGGDIDGDPRPMGHGYDLGADELPIRLVVTKRTDADPVPAGQKLTYVIQITNTGDLDLHAIVTDTLPAHVTPGGTLVWTPTITALGGVWTQHVVVTTEMYYAGLLTNRVQVSSKEGATGVYTTTSSVVAEYDIYLPLLARNWGPPEFCAPQLVRKISTGPQPHGVALDTAGGRAFIAHAAGVTVVDTHSFAVITDTRTFTLAQGIAYDADRDRIWVARRSPDRVLVLDGATYAPLADLPTGHKPLGVAYNPANDRVYVSNFFSWTVSVYDAETLTHLEDLTDFAEPSHLAVNPITNKIYVANHWPYNHVTVVDGATHDSHRILTGLLDGYGVAVDATRNLIYVTAIAQGRVVVIDGATEAQLGYLDVKRGSGARVPLRVIAVNPNAGPEGHLWLVTSSEDGDSDQLLLIPNGWPTLGTPVPLDIAPYPLDGIVYDPSSDQVWVTSVGSGLVSVVQDGQPVCSIPFSTGAEQERQFSVQAFTYP